MNSSLGSLDCVYIAIEVRGESFGMAASLFALAASL